MEGTRDETHGRVQLYISAITGHLSQASEDSSVHRVIFEHTTIVTDSLLLANLAVTSTEAALKILD